MNARIKKKIFTNMYNPKMHYSINQILTATKGLFLTPLLMKNGHRYYMSHSCGKITKYDKEEAEKTFKDLKFEPHPCAIALKETFAHRCNIDPHMQEMCNATQARMDFSNGYGISVICGIQFYSNGKDTYEVGVFDEDILIRYFPEDSVRGHLTADEVTEIMIELQKARQEETK